MRASSLISFVLAIVFAAGAVFLANAWLSNQRNQQPVAGVAPALETTTIVVAAKDLTFGETLQSETLREIPWPKSSLPDGSFGKITDLLSGGSRKALTSISPNEPILKWKISGAGGRATLSTTVVEGMRAVSVRVNEMAGVGGFILPGDRVDLLYTRTASNAEGDSASTDVIIQNARVLAVDQLADQKSEAPVVVKVVTVEVATIDAQKVALAQTTGTLSLSLRAAGSVDRAEAQRVVEEELVSNPSVYMAKINAQNASQVALEATLNAKIRQVEQKLAQSDTSKEALAAKMAEIEKRLKEQIGSAGADAKAMRAEYAALQAAFKASNGQMSDELRKRLAAFEANFNTKITPVAAVAAVAEALIPEKTTITIGVTRGGKRDTYEVPED